MSRTLKTLAAASVLAATAGVAATELIERSMPSATPPSPYASQSPADCRTPELDPVNCVLSDGECP